MARHSTSRTRSRVFVIIAFLVVAYIIFDRMMEKYEQSAVIGSSPELIIQKQIAQKEKIKVLPEWKLNNLAGGVFESSYLKGDVALITFWSSVCGVCRSEFPLLKDLDVEYKDKGFKIVAIALDDHEDEDLRAFVIGEKINYIVLRGDRKVTKQFGEIDVVPQSFLVDRQGNVIKYFLGQIDPKEIRSLIESAL